VPDTRFAKGPFVAVVIYGLDEDPVTSVLTEPGEIAQLSDLYEGYAYVKLCTTREEADAFVEEHAPRSFGMDDLDFDDDPEG